MNEEGPITLVRLYNGRMIIGKADNEVEATAEKCHLTDPRSILMAPTASGTMGIVLAPVCEPFKVQRLEKEISIHYSQIMFSLDESEIDSELVNGYKSEISGIKIATAAETAAVNGKNAGGIII